jgi:hypothetical protein
MRSCGSFARRGDGAIGGELRMSHDPRSTMLLALTTNPIRIPPVRYRRPRPSRRDCRIAGFAGDNVTIPHKERITTYLDEVDDLAVGMGAVNTVVVHDNGRSTGTNTDWLGIVDGLQRFGHPRQVARGRSATGRRAYRRDIRITLGDANLKVE